MISIIRSFMRFLLSSKNKHVYRKVAIECKSTGWHVYRLAHGKNAKNSKDYCILLQLKQDGVIERVFYQGG